MGSSDREELGDLGGLEIRETQPLVDLLTRPEDLDLPHVRVLARVLVLKNENLNIDGADVVLLGVVEQFGLEGDGVPAGRFFELDVLHFLEVLHVVARPDGQLRWSVGLV